MVLQRIYGLRIAEPATIVLTTRTDGGSGGDDVNYSPLESPGGAPTPLPRDAPGSGAGAERRRSGNGSGGSTVCTTRTLFNANA